MKKLKIEPKIQETFHEFYQPLWNSADVLCSKMEFHDCKSTCWVWPFTSTWPISYSYSQQGLWMKGQRKITLISKGIPRYVDIFEEEEVTPLTEIVANINCTNNEIETKTADPLNMLNQLRGIIQKLSKNQVSFWKVQAIIHYGDK